MSSITKWVYKDGDSFYFDPENYENDNSLTDCSLEYEDGDSVKWFWEDKKMFGTLRAFNAQGNLFVIKDVVELT